MESDAAEILRRQTQRLWHYQTRRQTYRLWTAGTLAAPSAHLTFEEMQAAHNMCSAVRQTPPTEDTMTKKHFIAIAEILNTFYRKNYNPDFDDTIDQLCCYFNSINSEFDEDKFKDAVCRRRE